MSNPDKTFVDQTLEILCKFGNAVYDKAASPDYDFDSLFEEAQQALLSAHQSDIERIIGQPEPLIGDSDQFNIVENNKVVRNNLNAEQRERAAINTKEEEKTT